MKSWAKFWYYFLFGGPSPALLGAFTLGLLVVGVLSNLAYDLLIGQVPLSALWMPLSGSVVLTGVAYGLYRRDQQRKVHVGVNVDESRLAPAHAGLIWLFGPGGFDHLLHALSHHHRAGGAQHCWLVMQDSLPVKQAFARLSEALPERELPTRLHPVYVHDLSVQAAYRATRLIFERECVEVNLSPERIIADITGGTKPLTAGMVLATLTSHGHLEYVETDRDAQGHVIPGTARVVLVDTDVYAARGRRAEE
jgi:hypothetical protein